MRRAAMVPLRDCAGGLSVSFGFLENMPMSKSFTRFNPMTGQVYCCVGAAGHPAFDAAIDGLDDADKAWVSKLLVAIEHEKQHAHQIVQMFQVPVPDATTSRMVMDYAIYATNPTLRDLLYRYDMCECDATLEGIRRGFAIASKLFGEELAGNAVCGMYGYGGVGKITASRYMMTDEAVTFESVDELVDAVARHAENASVVDDIGNAAVVCGKPDILWQVLHAGGRCRDGRVPEEAAMRLGPVPVMASLCAYASPEYGVMLPALAAVADPAAFERAVAVIGADGAGHVERMRDGKVAQFSDPVNVSRRNGNRASKVMAKLPGIAALFEKWPEAGWEFDEETRRVDNDRGFRI